MAARAWRQMSCATQWLTGWRCWSRCQPCRLRGCVMQPWWRGLQPPWSGIASCWQSGNILLRPVKAVGTARRWGLCCSLPIGCGSRGAWHHQASRSCCLACQVLWLPRGGVSHWLPRWCSGFWGGMWRCRAGLFRPLPSFPMTGCGQWICPWLVGCLRGTWSAW